MNNKIKKMLAKEGLIILGFVVGCYFISVALTMLTANYSVPIAEKYNFLFLFSYSIFLIIRFIVWAIRTLKQKS